MESLATRQRAFLDHVRGHSAHAPRLAEGTVAPARGLEVYTHAYRARLREALAADHPRLARSLGSAAWSGVCDDYIDAHPSHGPSLRTFGNALPSHLAMHAAITRTDVELAAFERDLLDAFDAADAPRVVWCEVEALPAAAWPTLRAELHPSVRRLALTTTAVALWQRLGDEDDDASRHAATEVPAAVLLWRDISRITRFRTVAADEDLAVAGVLDGGDFSALCDGQRRFHAEGAIPALAVGWLRGWVDDGLLSRLDVSPTDPSPLPLLPTARSGDAESRPGDA